MHEDCWSHPVAFGCRPESGREFGIVTAGLLSLSGCEAPRADRAGLRINVCPCHFVGGHWIGARLALSRAEVACAFATGGFGCTRRWGYELEQFGGCSVSDKG